MYSDERDQKKRKRERERESQRETFVDTGRNWGSSAVSMLRERYN